MSSRPPPTLYFHFSISGTFGPDEVTTATSLSPARTWRKGELVGRRRRVTEDDFWDYRIGPVEASDVGPHLASLMQALVPSLAYLTSLRESSPVAYIVTVSIWTPEHPLSYAPIMFIEPQLLSQVTSLGASLQVDLNLLADDDPKDDAINGPTDGAN